MDSHDTEKTMQDSPNGDVASQLPPGGSLGHYRIQRRVGQGGMGEVYQAEHIHLGTRHAVKTILESFSARPGFRSQFEQEAQVMARLRHPHIVRVTDFGYEGDMPFIVMDFIAGPHGDPMDLRQLLDHRKTKGETLDEDEAVAVGLEICRALAYAHSFQDDLVHNGIVHRDLKPANILVDEDTMLHVTDFGLARMLGEGFESTMIEKSMSYQKSYGSDVTMGRETSTHSSYVGTFDYMSPEQREGRKADVRSDVYAMGAILYELLTGRKVAGVPQRPSKVDPSLSPLWDELLLEKCLTYDPSDRFQSANDMIGAVNDVLNRASAASPPPLLSKTQPIEPPVQKPPPIPVARTVEAKKPRAVLGQSMSAAEVEAGRTMAILCYALSFFGLPFFVVPLILRKDRFAVYHAWQCLALCLAALIGFLLSGLLVVIVIGVLMWLFVVIWVEAACIRGLLHASDGKARPLPWIGRWGEAWFAKWPIKR